MHKMKISTLPRHNTLFIVSIFVLFVVSSFASTDFEYDPENEVTESKQSRNEGEADGISDTGPAHRFKEHDYRQRQGVTRDSVSKSKEEDPVQAFLTKNKTNIQNKEQGNRGPVNDSDQKDFDTEDEIPDTQRSDPGMDNAEIRNEAETDGIADTRSVREFVPQTQENSHQGQNVTRHNEGQGVRKDNVPKSKEEDPVQVFLTKNKTNIHNKEQGPVSDSDQKDLDTQYKIPDTQRSDTGIDDKDSRNEDETHGSADTKSAQEYIEGKEQDNHQSSNVIQDLESKSKENPYQVISTRTDNNVPSRDEYSQGPVDDVQDYSEHPEPEDETQESSDSDSGIHEKENGTDRKDDDNQTPMTNGVEEYSENTESEDETRGSTVSESGIHDEDSKPESETDSKDEEIGMLTNDTEDFSENSEPEDETQDSPVSDSGIHEKDSRPESETSSKDEHNQEPMDDAEDNFESPEPKGESLKSQGSDSSIPDKDSRDESETDGKDEDIQGPTSDAHDYSEHPKPEDVTQESPGSDTLIREKDSRHESETSYKGDDDQTRMNEFSENKEQDSHQRPYMIKDHESKSKENPVQGPKNVAEDYTEHPEPEDETRESPDSVSSIHEKDSRHESGTSSKYKDTKEPMNDAQDHSENPGPEDVTQESHPASESGVHGDASKPESETQSKGDDSHGPMNDEQDYSKNQESEDEAQESPVTDSGIYEKDSRMESQTDGIDQTQSNKEFFENKEHYDHQRQDVTRKNLKSKGVFLSNENSDDQSVEQGPVIDSDFYSKNQELENEMHNSRSSDSDMNDKSMETHHTKNGNAKNFNKTNPVHVFLKGKKHHRQNVMHEKINKTNPVHVFLKDKKHHRQNDINKNVDKTNPVNVSSKDQKHHRQNGMHEIVDQPNPVHVHVKHTKHEDQANSQNGYGVKEHSHEESQSPMEDEIHGTGSHGSKSHNGYKKDKYLVEEFLRARDHQQHVHKSHGFEGIKGYSGLDSGGHRSPKTNPGMQRDEHDKAKEIKSSESVLIPQESVKVADLLHISSEVKHLDTVVHRISGFVRKTLADIQKNMHEMANMVSAVHPIAPSTMSHMIDVTMTKTEKAVRKLCLEPIQKSLSIPPWSAWNSWGKCSLTCGSGGYRLRHRQCQSKSHRQCLGNDFDLSHCVLTPCPATWQAWSQWTPCSATCDNGHQMRTRMCLTSSEKVYCNGTTSEIKDCFSHKCESSVGQKSTLLGHLHFKSKSGNKVKFHMKFATQGSTQASSGYSWSVWSGWTSCKECRKGHRERSRMCVNSLKQRLADKTLCPGADVEFGPCTGVVCNLDNAVYVSEGKSREVKCAVPPDLIPSRIYWITPRNQHITHLSTSKRIRMTGSSLRVAAARYADQGGYRCVLLLNNNTQHIIQGTLVVDTCKTHHCQNGGTCQTTQDPEFDGIMNYKCRCIGKYTGPFCEIGPLNSNKFIGAIIALIIALVVVLALALFLLRRSLHRTETDSPKEYQWKNKGKSQTKKKTKCPNSDNRPKPAERPEDKGDISNTSIVSNDGSFVEITEYDYVDFDGLNFSQEEKNPRGGYESGHASGGYEGKFLKYPSPPHKHLSQNYQQNEPDYLTMDTLPQNFNSHRNNPAGFYDEESAYQNMCSGKVENFYENLPTGERGEPVYAPTSKSEQEYIETLKYKASLKQRRASVDKEALAQEALDIVAENLTRQCLVEIENESQNANKVVSTGLNSSQIGSGAPKLIKDKPRGKHVPMDTDKNISTVQTDPPNWNAENIKSPKRKTKSIKQTKSPQKQETGKFSKSLNTGASAGHQSVSHNKASGEASDPKLNSPVDKAGRESPPRSQGFKQQLVTQTDARSPYVSKDRKPVPKPRRASEDTARQLQIRPPVSPTHRQYTFPKTLTIKDEKQEAALQEHFDTSFVTQQVNPSTSTPKKVDKIACMNIIMPSDIMQADEDESSLTLGRKTHSSELMVVTSSKVLGKTEEGPVNLGRGNISSNNRQTSASELSSGSEVFSDSYYQSLSQVTEPTGGSTGTSFRSLDTSTSLQTMPDLDNTVSFPKLTISYQEEGLGQAFGHATPSETEHCYPERNDSLFQGELTEGSLYLSDCNYTQDTLESSELSASERSSDQTSDVESLDCTES